jgi:membrane-associated phospholipid phosphatase
VKTTAFASFLVLLSYAPASAAPSETPGTILSVAIPAGAATGALLVHDKHGLLQLAEAYASTMALVYTLKPLVDRTRPDGGAQSFPSGHAASAFAGASFVQIRYGWRLGLPMYVLAGYVGYSRVATHRHYTSDVLAGGAIGIAANLVFTRHREHVALSPDLGRGRAGARLTIAW